jgi:hypothetical protein
LTKEAERTEEKPTVMAITREQVNFRGRFRSRGSRIFGRGRGRGGPKSYFQATRGQYRGRGGRFANGRNRFNNKFCSHCRRPNHNTAECRYLKKKESTIQNRPENQQVNMVSAMGDDEFGFVGMAGHEGNVENLNFYIDTGSTDHLITDLELLTNVKILNPPKQLNLAKRKLALFATRVGDVEVVTNKNYKLTLKQVYYTPDCRCNLLSAKKLQRQKINFKLEDHTVFLYTKINQNENILAIGDSVDDSLYKFRFKAPKIHDNRLTQNNNTFVMSVSATEDLLHRRLGHLSFANLKLLLPNIKETNKVCEICVMAKQSRKPLAKKKIITQPIKPLDRVHTDVCTLPETSENGEKYFVTFIEGYTHYTVVYLLREKSEVFKYYQQYESRICALLNGKCIKMLYCDNGGEYTSNEFKSHAASQGTELHYTIRDTPALNGVAERMNRTLLDRGRALLFDSGMPKRFWSYAVLTSVYLINRSPTRALPENKTPYEMLKNEKRNYSDLHSNLRIFGCVAYSKTLSASKLDEKSEKCILVGYVHNGYKLFNLRTKRIIVVRDVIFDEATLYKNLGENEKIPENEMAKMMENADLSHKLNKNANINKYTVEDVNPSTSRSQMRTVEEGNPSIRNLNIVGDDVNPSTSETRTVKEVNPFIRNYPVENVDLSTNIKNTHFAENDNLFAKAKRINAAENVDLSARKRGGHNTNLFNVQKRIKNTNPNLSVNNNPPCDVSSAGDDGKNQQKIDHTYCRSNEPKKSVNTDDRSFHDRSNKSEKRANTDHTYSRSDKKLKKDTTNVANVSSLQNSNALTEKFSENYNTLSQMNDCDGFSIFIENDNGIPANYAEIKNTINSDKWFQAVNVELNSLKQNKTWILVDRPKNKNIVGCKWVFRIKRNNKNEIEKYKARLVAQGFSQKYGSDYSETFAPVAKMTSFRILMSIAVQYDLLVEQCDVQTAYLHSELEEEIYMRVPEGITYSGDKVCLLKKSLYGLKQSSRCWNKSLDSYVKSIGFQNSKSDYCVYFLPNREVQDNIYILVYVDDILCLAKDKNKINLLKQKLFSRFNMTDEGPLSYYLGITITRNNDHIYLSQENYLQNLLIKCNMENCNPISTPLEVKIPVDELEISDDNPENSKFPIRNVIGSLMYAMLATRPDLCYAISLLSRYQTKPSQRLWRLLKRVLRYVKGTLNYKLVFTKNRNYCEPIVAYVDASYATNDAEAHSTSGCVIKMFENNLVAWSSRRQSTVALCTMIAEYYALCDITRDIMWMRQFIESLRIDISNPTIVYEDNAGCIEISSNPSNHKGTRQLNTKLFFVRDELNKSIKLEYIRTEENVADFFTKSLPAARFNILRKSIGLQKIEK